VCGVVAGDVREVLGKIGADQFAVDALEVVVALAVRRVNDQVEVACVHPQGLEVGLDDGVRPKNVVGHEDGGPLPD
jgi:hypothetical protein